MATNSDFFSPLFSVKNNDSNYLTGGGRILQELGQPTNDGLCHLRYPLPSNPTTNYTYYQTP